MWGKIIIPMYRLWLNGLYGLYGPRCPLSSKRPINLISLSLSPMRASYEVSFELWGVFREVKVWFMFFLCNYHAVSNIVWYLTAVTQQFWYYFVIESRPRLTNYAICRYTVPAKMNFNVRYCHKVTCQLLFFQMCRCLSSISINSTFHNAINFNKFAKRYLIIWNRMSLDISLAALLPQWWN